MADKIRGVPAAFMEPVDGVAASRLEREIGPLLDDEISGLGLDHGPDYNTAFAFPRRRTKSSVDSRFGFG